MTTWATRRLDELLAGAEPPPVIRTFRLGTLDAWGAGWVKKTWPATPDTLNADGSLFGGLIAALADQALAFAAMTVVPEGQFFRTANLHVQFFKPAKDGVLHIEANVSAQSAQVIHVRCVFRDGSGNLVAEATAQQIVRPAG